MGVVGLWPILEAAKERRTLETLQGKCVAIDLGFWVCQMQTAVQNPTVVKPYLRNLFFRVSALLQRQIRVLAVADGKPPELKRKAMAERYKARNKQAHFNPDAPAKRSKFTLYLNECMDMLRLMGVSVLNSEGEAEACCAALNAAGHVDAVITEDNDALLYGARLVVRNFNLDGKDPEADFYSMEAIERKLRLTRNKLVALGLFLGNDYCSTGVPGVGKEGALKYLNMFDKSEDHWILQRMRSLQAADDGKMLDLLMTKTDAFRKLDSSIQKKVESATDLPIAGIIDEYTTEIAVTKPDTTWNLPDFVKLEGFLFRHIEWVSEYSISKVVPLLTLWKLLNIQNASGLGNFIKAERIVKPRVKNGKMFYEIQWLKFDVDVWTTDKDYYVTLERKELIDECYPNLVEEYELCKKTKKTRIGVKRNKTAVKAAEKESEEKENDNILEVSEILERSLVIIDDMDGVDSDPIIEIIEESKPVEASKATTPKAARKSKALTNKSENVGVTTVSDTDSPLPLWKRVALRIQDENKD